MAGSLEGAFAELTVRDESGDERVFEPLEFTGSGWPGVDPSCLVGKTLKDRRLTNSENEIRLEMTDGMHFTCRIQDFDPEGNASSEMEASPDLDEGGVAPAITEARLLRGRDKAASIWWGGGWRDQQHTCLGIKFEGRQEWHIVQCRNMEWDDELDRQLWNWDNVYLDRCAPPQRTRGRGRGRGRGRRGTY